MRPLKLGPIFLLPLLAACTGPMPATRLKRVMVTGMPPRVAKSVDQPPPRK